MATLVLNSLGSALGGPFGGAIGALLGQQIDQRLFGRDAIEGPRLGDLSIQGSRYGAQVPAIYGRMRIAGTIIWATDLTESETVSGAKGQPDRVSYSYAANFAVALSSRVKGEIGRVWADGKLLRGSAGDLKVPGTMRVLNGGERQDVDPLIGSAEGAAPAYRDFLTVVFESLELAEYGNRIPMLTFEILADDAPTVGDISDEASDGLIVSGNKKSVEGYALHGRDLGSALAPLMRFGRCKLVAAGEQLEERSDGASAFIDPNELDAAAGSEVDRREERLVPDSEMPRSVQIDYYDVDRDYQSGRSRAVGAGGMRASDVDAPMALSANDARSWVEEEMQRLWRERRSVRLSFMPKRFGLRPGDRLVLPGETEEWRVASLELERFVVKVEALRVGQGKRIAPLPSGHGRAIDTPGVQAVPTQIALFEPPDLNGSRQAAVLVAAANASPGWRAIPLDVDIGGLDHDRQSAGREAICGFAESVLETGCCALVDRQSMLIVQLAGSDVGLLSESDDALLGGANLAMLGSELVQFGHVEAIGENRFLLKTFLRGRRGTEWAMAGHEVGEPFLMLDPVRVARLPLMPEQVGTNVVVTPQGLGDDGAASTSHTFSGEALRPPSPVQLKISRTSEDVRIGWIRRSRDGYHWNDGVGIPIGESAERYRVVVRNDGGASIAVETVQTNHIVQHAELDVLGPGPFTVDVRMIGDLALSHPVTTRFD